MTTGYNTVKVLFLKLKATFVIYWLVRCLHFADGLILVVSLNWVIILILYWLLYFRLFLYEWFCYKYFNTILFTNVQAAFCRCYVFRKIIKLIYLLRVCYCIYIWHFYKHSQINNLILQYMYCLLYVGLPWTLVVLNIFGTI